MKKSLFFMIAMLSLSSMRAIFQVISQPGLYQLGENLTYNPSVINDVVFQITSSDVVLDLNYHVITQVGVTAGLIGIQVNSGLSNVVIKNGTIQNLTGRGIQVLSNCSRIILEGITTFDCDVRGIDFVGAGGNLITDSIVRDCSVVQCSTNGGGTSAVNLTFCSRFLIENLYAGLNGASNHSIGTISLTNSNECLFKKMIVENTAGTNPTRSVIFTSSTGCWFTDCIIDTTVASQNNPSCSGYELDTASSNNIFTNCISSKTVAVAGAAATVNGFLINGPDNVFINCYAKDALGALARGFSVGAVGNRNMFVNCVAVNNNAIVNTSIGFRSLAASAITYIYCKSLNQVSTPNTGSGWDLQGTTESSLNKCVAYRNTGVNAANSCGYRQLGSVNITAVENLSSSSATPFTGFAVGAINTVAATTVNATTIGPWTNLGTV